MGADVQPEMSSAARCGVHPAEAADATCPRCGSFTCGLCREGGSGLCAGCRARAEPAFSLTRDRWSLGELSDVAIQAFKRNWLLLSAAVLVAYAIRQGVQTGLQVVMQPLWHLSDGAIPGWLAVSVVPTVAGWLVDGVMRLGLFRLSVDAIVRRPISFGMLFSGVFLVGRYLLAACLLGLPVMALVASVAGTAAVLSSVHSLGAGLLLGAAVVLGVIYGVVVGPPALFVIPELVTAPRASTVEVLRRCFALVRGQRWPVIGIAVLTSLLEIAGVLACAVGYLPAVALSQLVRTGLFLALRNGSALPAPEAPAIIPGTP